MRHSNIPWDTQRRKFDINKSGNDIGTLNVSIVDIIIEKNIDAIKSKHMYANQNDDFLIQEYCINFDIFFSFSANNCVEEMIVRAVIAQ